MLYLYITSPIWVLIKSPFTIPFFDFRKTCQTKNTVKDDPRPPDSSSEKEETNIDDLVTANESAANSGAENKVYRKTRYSTRSLTVTGSDYDGDSACDDNDSGDSVCDNDDSDDPRTFDSLEANEAYKRVVHSVKLPSRKVDVDSEDSEQDSSWIQSPELSGEEDGEEEEEVVETAKKEEVPQKPPRAYICMSVCMYVHLCVCVRACVFFVLVTSLYMYRQVTIAITIIFIDPK